MKSERKGRQRRRSSLGALFTVDHLCLAAQTKASLPVPAGLSRASRRLAGRRPALAHLCLAASGLRASQGERLPTRLHALRWRAGGQAVGASRGALAHLPLACRPR
jgi:hypothetical protein